MFIQASLRIIVDVGWISPHYVNSLQLTQGVLSRVRLVFLYIELVLLVWIGLFVAVKIVHGIVLV